MIIIPALLISACVLTLTAQSIFTKQYNVKCPKGELTYSALTILFALLFFVVSTKNIAFSKEIVPYSVAFSAAYTISTLTNVLALKIGSLAITSLVMSYSLIIPTVYGLCNGEELTVIKVIGITLLLVSLFLIRSKSEEQDKKTFSLKWLIYVMIAFFTNGMCSILQDAQENHFKGAQNGNFMILALLIGFVALMSVAVICEGKAVLESIKKGLAFSAATGICNGATNLLVMVIIGMVATSVFFPVLSACQLILTFIISAFFFKEKFIPRQIVGLGFGIAALVLLNL